MERLRIALLLGCALSGTAAAQSAGTLGAPVFTIHPQGALPTFAGDSVDVVVGWRPVVDAIAYRVTLTDASGHATAIDTAELRFETHKLAPGNYQLTIAAVDRTGTAGPASEVLPINVIEVRAIPPGGDRAVPPTRGAYAVGTTFSVAGMHCEFGDAPIDDLLVGPENEARIPMAGVALLRCAGLPGYLEKQVVIAPVRVATQSPRVVRGGTTTINITLASVASLGERLDVEAIGDITLGEAQRTEFGLEVPVTAAADAKSATLSVQSAGFEIGRVALELVEGRGPSGPPPSEPLPPLDFKALDLGGFIGLFSPPSSETSGTTLGHPSQRADIITGGPLVGLRLGYFPVSRVGVVGEASLIAGGYVDEANVSQILAGRGSLEVRALESGSLGLRLFAGAGALRTLKTRGTSHPATDTELHAGAAATIETSPNLWLRFQISDVVTTARDDGYAHCLELQLSVMTRLGRRDSF
jgi:hypothetical protein